VISANDCRKVVQSERGGLVMGFLRQGVGLYDLGLGGVGFLGWKASRVGVVLRFIYLFLVWESWDTRFWRRVFLDFFYCFWGKGGGWLLDLIFF
jgi:hypothetical protein